MFNCQSANLTMLKQLADRRAPSILIAGPSGSGKSWMAREYARYLSIEDFVLVDPTVSSIREIADVCADKHTPMVVCVENLDLGVVAASYTLLKFLEEPQPDIHIVVTVRNINHIPTTIPSRCVTVWAAAPLPSDLIQYGETRNFAKFNQLKDTIMFKACLGFNDVDALLDMDTTKLAYYGQLPDILQSKDSVSGLVWKLTHYADNSALDPLFALQCITSAFQGRIAKYGRRCVGDIQSGRVAAHTAITKFIFDCRYGQ